MIFSRERVSANNSESFLFIGFLLIFAIAASWYVWVKGTILLPYYSRNIHFTPHSRTGIERDLKKSKLLLDCILIITSVVPPELPMELSLAVNASLVALARYGMLDTPFRFFFQNAEAHPRKQSSALSHSESHSLGVSISVVSTRRGPSLPKVWSWRDSLDSSMLSSLALSSFAGEDCPPVQAIDTSFSK